MKRHIVQIVLGIGSLVLLILILESLIRLFPTFIPKGSYGSTRFSEVGLYVHDDIMIYNNIRFCRRKPNRDGFLDVEHKTEKPKGTFRVGLFGDSYVEARQVVEDRTFHRLIPEEISGRRIETLAFGISGWGTAASLVAYQAFGDRYDLDLVIHTFVKNDPGDNHFGMQQAAGRARKRPSASLSKQEPGFEIRYPQEPERRLGPIRTLDAILEKRSLCYKVISMRMTALRDRSHEEDARKAGFADQNDPPSEWPPRILFESKLLTSRILKCFQEEVAEAGRRFALLYVPRGHKELSGRMEPQDVWRPWVGEMCDDLGIIMIDPTPAFLNRFEEGAVIYDDHWSPLGHEIVAATITEYLEQIIAETKIDDS